VYLSLLRLRASLTRRSRLFSTLIADPDTGGVWLWCGEGE